MDRGSAPPSNLTHPAVSVSTSRSPETRDDSLRHQAQDSPFSLGSPSSGPRCEDPPVVSSPFVNLSSSGNPSLVVPFAEAGPVRLTRFVEMSLDSYAHLNGMVSSGAFQHIGRASIRVEGTSAWGVWLRIDHWPSALGRHPLLRCGVLYHDANRTLSFHGIAKDAVQYLLPHLKAGLFRRCPSYLPSGSRALRLFHCQYLLHRHQGLHPRRSQRCGNWSISW